MQGPEPQFCSDVTAQKQPSSLFSCCISFVAVNLDLVETFQGFPSQIGEKIFEAAKSCVRMVDDDNYSKHAIGLFSDAFQEEVLSSLTVSGHHLGLNFYEDHLKLFVYITHLDLSNCGLGDDHDFLSNISKLARLQVLSLRNDVLSDKGVQKLTTPYRMFQQGPSDLVSMDLSENSGISERSLKYLSCFPHLDALIVTRTSVVVKALKGWQSEMVETSPLSQITNQGWASSVVDNWMSTALNKAKEIQLRKKKSTFYSRPVVKLDSPVSVRQRLIGTRPECQLVLKRDHAIFRGNSSSWCHTKPTIQKHKTASDNNQVLISMLEDGNALHSSHKDKINVRVNSNKQISHLGFGGSQCCASTDEDLLNDYLGGTGHVNVTTRHFNDVENIPVAEICSVGKKVNPFKRKRTVQDKESFLAKKGKFSS